MYSMYTVVWKIEVHGACQGTKAPSFPPLVPRQALLARDASLAGLSMEHEAPRLWASGEGACYYYEAPRLWATHRERAQRSRLVLRDTRIWASGATTILYPCPSLIPHYIPLVAVYTMRLVPACGNV